MTQYRTCDVCKYWQREGDHFGECRRNAPTPQNKDLREPIGAWWPATNDDDWCGEFQPVSH